MHFWTESQVSQWCGVQLQSTHCSALISYAYIGLNWSQAWHAWSMQLHPSHYLAKQYDAHVADLDHMHTSNEACSCIHHTTCQCIMMQMWLNCAKCITLMYHVCCINNNEWSCVIHATSPWLFSHPCELTAQLLLMASSKPAKCQLPCPRAHRCCLHTHMPLNHCARQQWHSTCTTTSWEWTSWTTICFIDLYLHWQPNAHNLDMLHICDLLWCLPSRKHWTNAQLHCVFLQP